MFVKEIAVMSELKSRPTVVIDDVECQVELVYHSDIPFYDIIYYQEAADYFKMNECSAVIGALNAYSQAMKTYAQ